LNGFTHDSKVVCLGAGRLTAIADRPLREGLLNRVGKSTGAET
jgi:hypothetical protein